MVKKKVFDPHQHRQYNAQVEVNRRWDKYTPVFTKGVLWPRNSKAVLDKIKNSLEKQKEVFRGQLSIYIVPHRQLLIKLEKMGKFLVFVRLERHRVREISSGGC